MLKKIIPAMIIMLLFSACTIQHAKLDSNPAFTPHQYSSHDLNVLWKSEKTDTGIRIAGTVTNARSDLPYNSLQLTAKLLDQQGNVLAKGSHVFLDRFTGTEPFKIDIPLEKKESVKYINFSYSYGTAEDHFVDTFKSEP